MFRSMILAGLASLLLASPTAWAHSNIAITVGGPGWALSVAPSVVLQPVLPVRVVPAWGPYGGYAPAPAWGPAPAWRGIEPQRWGGRDHWRHRHHRDWRGDDRRDAHGRDRDWRRDDDRGHAHDHRERRGRDRD